MVITDIMTNAAEFGELYYNNPNHSLKQWTRRLVGFLYPRWVLEHRGRKLLRLPSAGMVLAKEWLGLAPPLPWQIHSGYADAILLESEQVRQYGISNGLPPEQLIATGTVSMDMMSKVLQEVPKHRADLYRRLNIAENKPMILLAMPQDDHPTGYVRPFPTYKDMVRFLVSSLSACQDYNLVVCLHPSTEYDSIKYIEDWGAKIAKEPTARLVPLCDINVATVSSTIKWAIACGKPTIAYDYGRHQSPAYVGAKGVITKEPLRPGARIGQASEAFGIHRLILKGFELRLGEGVVVGNARARVALGQAEVGQQQRQRYINSSRRIPAST